MLAGLLLSLLLLARTALCLDSTDSIRDADPGQSGYLPNHNIDPSIVSSEIFGILWKNTYDSKEKWYAKPLVYTPPGQKQLVFLASSQNWIRTVDAVTGAAIAERQVQPPFLQSDIGCTDIPDFIGIIGTPIIDPATDTAYFFSKGYKNGAASGGVANGIYKLYAVNVIDLSDRPGFPVLIDGNFADNDNARYFIGGTVLQRPSLTIVSGVIYGGFGGHCDLFNYTGMVVGVSTQPNVGVVSIYAMEASPFAPPVTSNIFDEKGGKAGIWQGGMGLSTDGSRLFLATGNGQGHQNKETPASGRTLLSTLDECVVNLAVGPGGKLSLSDYFEPYEYIGMDAGDRDLGSSGVSLLDPAVFKGNGVSRMAVVVGKNGKAYIMNADNLGGYKLGPGGTDAVLQTIIAAGSIFGGSGSYPLEGGYIYYTPVGAPTVAYGLGFDGAGSPVFSKVGQSPDNSAGRVGVGVPTVTTYKGQPGTGILWIPDVDAGLKAYKAVPDASGNLVRINLPPTNGLNKFQRPAFGNGRLYVSDSDGNVICLGSPVSLPLNCSSPVDFGQVSLGSTSTRTVTCTALIPITSIAGVVMSNPTWQASNSSLPQGALTPGQQFSFPVIWNLTSASIENAKNASFGSVSPGVKSGSATVRTNNGVADYSSSLPISLTGVQVSSKPFLQTSPQEVDFGGVVVNGIGSQSGIDSSFIITNAGNTTLTITGYAYTPDFDPPVEYSNTSTAQGGGTIIGSHFISSSLPPVGTTVDPGQSLTVPVTFKSGGVGNYHVIFQVWSNGGTSYVLMTGSATTAAIGSIAVSTSENGWDPNLVMDFGRVKAGTTVTRRIRICNNGGSSLLITKSKPPIQSELRAQNPTGDLYEGQFIPPNECAYAAVDIAAAPATVNTPDHTVSDVWVLNTNDVEFGAREVKVSAVFYTPQVGPLLANGTSRYRYLGCYYDGDGRLLSDLSTPPNNENGVCQETCLSKGFVFAGTEYNTECWCGNDPPPASKFYPESAFKCTFSCPGDITQACGGDSAFISMYYDSQRYSPGSGSISTPSPASPGPPPTGGVGANSSATTSSPPAPTPTGPVVNPGNSRWSSLGCYLDPVTPSKALFPNSILENDNMTVAVCLDFCESVGTKYAGIEYRRECYCSDTLQSGATAGDPGCTLTCYNNATEYCGGSNRMSVYQAVSLQRASSRVNQAARIMAQSLNLSSLDASPISSSAASISNSTATTTPLATSPVTAGSVALVSSSTGVSNSTILANNDTTSAPSVGAATSFASLPSSTSYANLTASPSDSEALATSLVLPVTSDASVITSSDGSSTSDFVTSTSSSSVTTLAATLRSNSSSGEATAALPSSNSSSRSSAAAANAASTSSASNSAPTTATITTTTATATSGFYSAGCFAEPSTGRALPTLLLSSNASMAVERCIAAARAALPATTYRFLGLEAAHECWAGTAAPAPAPAPSAPPPMLPRMLTALVGSDACSMACRGNASQSCGAARQFNLYVASEAQRAFALNATARGVSVVTVTLGSVTTTSPSPSSLLSSSSPPSS